MIYKSWKIDNNLKTISNTFYIEMKYILIEWNALVKLFEKERTNQQFIEFEALRNTEPSATR